MHIETLQAPDCTILRVKENRIDAACAIQFKDKIGELTHDAAERIVLDLKRVEFIDSSGLGAIVGAMKQLPAGHVLELANPSTTVAKVLRLTRLDSVFKVHESFRRPRLN